MKLRDSISGRPKQRLRIGTAAVLAMRAFPARSSGFWRSGRRLGRRFAPRGIFPVVRKGPCSVPPTRGWNEVNPLRCKAELETAFVAGAATLRSGSGLHRRWKGKKFPPPEGGSAIDGGGAERRRGRDDLSEVPVRLSPRPRGAKPLSHERRAPPSGQHAFPFRALIVGRENTKSVDENREGRSRHSGAELVTGPRCGRVNSARPRRGVR